MSTSVPIFPIMGRIRFRWHELRKKVRNEGIVAACGGLVQRLRSDFLGARRRLDAWLHAKDGVVTLPIQGSIMCLRLDDPSFSRKLIRDGIWEPEHTQLMHEELRPGMVGMDLGANLGFFALLGARLVGPQGRVVAVEPLPQNASLLRRSAALNGYRHLVVHQAAVSNACGDAAMWVTDESNFGSLHSADDPAVSRQMRTSRIGDDNADRIAVATVTIDSLVELYGLRPLDYIRMDIEGFEVRATLAMGQTLRSAERPLKLFAEVHNDHFEDPCSVIGSWLADLLEAGFAPRALIVPGRIKGIIRDPSPRDFPEQVCQYKGQSPQVFLERA